MVRRRKEAGIDVFLDVAALVDVVIDQDSHAPAVFKR